MKIKDAASIVYPWWKPIDQDKDYQAESDKLLEEKTNGESIRSNI